MIFIVLINKEEKIALSKRFPRESFARTMRQDSKRHRYYCVERPVVMQYLEELRNKNVIEEHPPRKKQFNNNKKKNNYNNRQKTDRRWNNG